MPDSPQSSPLPQLTSGPIRLKTMLFDLGNVLVFFCHDRMCRQIGEVCNRSAADVREHLLDSSLQWEFERGFIDELELHARLEKLFECKIELPQLVRAVADIFELNTSMMPVLSELKRQGLRLVLLSNTCVSHVNFIRKRWDFLDLFDRLVLSYEVGAVKPDDEIYRVALNTIGCQPHECLYLDDIPMYVEKGRTFGLNAEVFTTTEQFLSTFNAKYR